MKQLLFLFISILVFSGCKKDKNKFNDGKQNPSIVGKWNVEKVNFQFTSNYEINDIKYEYENNSNKTFNNGSYLQFGSDNILTYKVIGLEESENAPKEGTIPYTYKDSIVHLPTHEEGNTSPFNSFTVTVLNETQLVFYFYDEYTQEETGPFGTPVWANHKDKYEILLSR